MSDRTMVPAVSWDFRKIPLFPRDRKQHPSSRLIAPPFPGGPQGKFAVEGACDPLEHEADRIADQVMSMPTPGVSSGTALTQHSRKCVACENNDSLQKMPAGPQTASGAPDIVNEVLRSPGQALDAATRDFFEPRFGRDLSAVRVHTGALAAQTARDMNAYAYTLGHNIVFGEAQFAPRTSQGKRLIAHEITHVVQQSDADGIPVTRSAGMHGAPPTSVLHSDKKLLRKGFESTVKICHRVLESRNFEVTSGGVRAVLLLEQLNYETPNCRDFDFGVTLTRSKDWSPDAEIGTCETATGGTRSFSFTNLPSGTYYLTIWRNFDHPHCCLQGDLLVFDEPASSDTSGCIRNKQLSAIDIVHGALDLAGFIPVLGAIPDGINAAIYVAEGDWESAGLSAIAMVPAWGDGVKLGAIAGKTAIKITEKAALKLGEEGIAKGLKEVKAVSKAEKTAVEATEGASRAEKGVLGEGAKAEKPKAKEAAKAERQETQEAQEADKAKDKRGDKGGKWTCYGRSAVLQIPKELPEHKCLLDGQYVDGPSVSAPSEAAACLAAKHAFNAMMPRGCRPKHLACRCSKR